MAWWENRLRVIQYNLQILDTPLLVPQEMVADAMEYGADALAINVGGIYAWYDTGVPFHTRNKEILSDGWMREIIRLCHESGLKIIARFDFSKADDEIYLLHPEWFVRNPDQTPHAYGVGRTGPWSVLYSTCINGGYRNKEVAAPVLREALTRFSFDAVFLNAPGYEPCFCAECREKYRRLKGIELPMEWADPPSASMWQPSPTLARRRSIRGVAADWEQICYQDNIRYLHQVIQSVDSTIPLILYFGNEEPDLSNHAQISEVSCIEAQDILSGGACRTPYWVPTLNAKIGASMRENPSVVIVHSCPGMDWRHVGLPEEEYRSWMCRAAANGATIWHSVTGTPRTIQDQRIASAIRQTNKEAHIAYVLMKDARSWAETLFVWTGSVSAQGWLVGLLHNHIQFDVADVKNFPHKLSEYSAVIIPSGWIPDPDSMKAVQAFVENGGNLLWEADSNATVSSMAKWLGIQQNIQESPELSASYLRFEGEKLRDGMEQTELIPFAGKMLFCRPEADSDILATLVPPFATLDSVGAPPERASLLVKKTEIPLCMKKKCGHGNVLFLPFSLGCLVSQFALKDQYLLLRNCVSQLYPDGMRFVMNFLPGLEVVIQHRKSGLLVHLINSVGERPLAWRCPLYGLNFSIRVPENVRVHRVSCPLGNSRVSFACSDSHVTVSVDRVEVWSLIEMEWCENDG